MKVQDVMTTDVATIGPDALLKDAAVELVRRKISGMPVVDDDARCSASSPRPTSSRRKATSTATAASCGGSSTPETRGSRRGSTP